MSGRAGRDRHFADKSAKELAHQPVSYSPRAKRAFPKKAAALAKKLWRIIRTQSERILVRKQSFTSPSPASRRSTDRRSHSSGRACLATLGDELPPHLGERAIPCGLIKVRSLPGGGNTLDFPVDARLCFALRRDAVELFVSLLPGFHEQSPLASRSSKGDSPLRH